MFVKILYEKKEYLNFTLAENVFIQIILNLIKLIK